MRLRIRLALFFAVFTSLTIALAFAVTAVVFHNAQQRSLDEALEARAQLEADEGLTLDGRTLHVQQAPGGTQPTALSQLLKYAAVLAPDGAVLAQTNTFGDSLLAPAPLGRDPKGLLESCFDFPWNQQVMRGTLVQLGAVHGHGYLLLAVPRDDLESDTYHLLRTMAAVFAAAVAVAVGFGLWFGTSTTRGIELVARVARRVTKGEMDARVDLARARWDTETLVLARDLNAMVDRLSSLISAERRFVSHAAHELRSPLAALRGELELALRHPRDVEAYKHAIGEALANTQRLQTLAEDLLTLARASFFAPITGGCRVSAVIAEALHASIANTAHACRIDTDVQTDLPVRGRLADLARLVRNLVDNAVGHAPAGSAVRITVRQDAPRSVVLAVEDDGPGVPLQIVGQIFDAFFRGDNERAESGAGLGLCIAREIARAHGGELTLESPAKPTRFCARFVVVEPEAVHD